MKRVAIVVLAVLAVACSDDGSPAADEDGGNEDGAQGSGDTAGVDADTAAGDSTGPLDPSLDDGAELDVTGADGSSTGDGPGEGGTPGCGLPVEPGAGEVELDVGSDARTYTIVVPAGYDPSTPMPLVFAWHGLASNAEQARAYFGVEEAAAGAAIFVYPNGLPLADMGGQSGWDLAPTGIDVAFFDAMLQQLSAEMCIDPARVFSTGHSFGGFMSNALGCFRGDALRAIGAVAGGPAFAACEPGRVAGLMVHGTLDEIVAFELGVMARDALLERNACADTTMPTDPDPCVAYDGCDAGYDVHWCEHSDPAFQGHTWPSWAGPAIWAFFAGLAPE
ncbi:MAG TPA: hypothetical protein VFG69_08625 [Nannocystaceae bacterium]|nr:hypothetical protein [Nannocystaceae bacterium]